MKATIPSGITLGQLEELAWHWGLNAVYDADSATLHLVEEDWITDQSNEDCLTLPKAA